MILKSLGLLVPLVAGGLYVSGAFGGGYHRDVDRPPAEVMEALADLDVRGQPGAPGTDPAASGGVEAVFRTERTADSISFVVLSGDKVATRMTAHLQPLDGGARTRVTATVERGDAPDDFVSPAFRSRGITMGLFSMAIESELNQLVAPPRRSAEECQEIEQRLLLANAPSGDRPRNLGQAVGGTVKTVLSLHAVEAELRRQGCSTEGSRDFREPSNVMGHGGDATIATQSPAPPPGVTFNAGQPMVDVSRH